MRHSFLASESAWRDVRVILAVGRSQRQVDGSYLFQPTGHSDTKPASSSMRLAVLSPGDATRGILTKTRRRNTSNLIILVFNCGFEFANCVCPTLRECLAPLAEFRQSFVHPSIGLRLVVVACLYSPPPAFRSQPAPDCRDGFLLPPMEVTPPSCFLHTMLIVEGTRLWTCAGCEVVIDSLTTPLRMESENVSLLTGRAREDQ